ncbi:carbohydrate-binding module family 13 protein [Artomyces pyxidatus]|uniref:Carbohydrate-binding module family 13 protein n=1 Tax=Artomyces pyxidatus TaxID=48021 RepID=A0ACB8TAQ9_9AGAM|nr:carbohydrate-binding module family 13 protein [Artomyces pyxidatus]
MSLQSGQSYVLVNYKAGTAFDLSGGDNQSIIGYEYHGGGNQQWLLQQVEGGAWTFRSVGTGKYLAVEGDPADGAKLIAVETDSPHTWDIWPDKEVPDAFRVFIHDTRFNIDLSDHGNPTPGTPVTLWTTWSGQNQIWKFQPV